MSFFTFFYSGLAVLLWGLIALLSPLLLFKQKYRHSFPARFFLFHNPPFEKRGIWFHAASLGEVRSLKPLIERLDGDKMISTVTQTGFFEAQKLSAQCRYLPYELLLFGWVKNQKALVVCEAELWYLLFLIAKEKGIKTYLINARISDRSYQSYLRFAWFYRKIFANIDTVFAQSDKDAARLAQLGAKNIIVNGNIKSFQKIEVSKHYSKPSCEVLTLASTHKNEEKLLFDHLDLSIKRQIWVVPRHPERFDEVDRLLQGISRQKGLSYHRFSGNRDLESDIVLMDVMGELINLYAISDIVILGGSFVQGVGGHNPLEPAHFGCKIISGKHIFNQEALYELIEGIEMIEIQALNSTLPKLRSSRIIQSGDIEPIIRELS